MERSFIKASFLPKIANLANIIAEKVGTLLDDKINISFESQEKDNGQLKKPCSNCKLLEVYEEAKYDCPIRDNIRSNLNDVIEWFLRNYDLYNRK